MVLLQPHKMPLSAGGAPLTMRVPHCVHLHDLSTRGRPRYQPATSFPVLLFIFNRSRNFPPTLCRQFHIPKSPLGSGSRRCPGVPTGISHKKPEPALDLNSVTSVGVGRFGDAGSPDSIPPHSRTILIISQFSNSIIRSDCHKL